MTVEAQAARTLRAQEQIDRYQFRAMTLKTSAGPVRIVYVYTPSGTTYQVTPGAHHARCSCPDYQKRCAGTMYSCKHIHMVAQWEQDGAWDAADRLRDQLAASVQQQVEQRAARAQEQEDAECLARLEARAAQVAASAEQASAARRRFLSQDFPEF